MRLLRKSALAVLVAILVPFGASARKPASGAEPQPTPALWRVTDDDSSIFLFGAIGLSPQGALWRSRAVGRAIDASETLWFEASVDDPAAQSAANKIFSEEGMLPKGTTLSSLLPADAAAAIEATVGSAGFTSETIEPLKPWAAFILLSSRIEPDANLETVDAAILREARGRGRQIKYFETVEDSLRRLTGMRQEVQIEIASQLIVNFESQRADALASFEAWRTGDLVAVDAHLNQSLREASPEAYQILVTDRIGTLAGAIETALKAPETSFISLNASYLAGPGSLPEALAAMGFRVERVGD